MGRVHLVTDCAQSIHTQNSLLVLHGASGLPPALVHETIKRGVCKFNVNTEVRAAAMRVVKGTSVGRMPCMVVCVRTAGGVVESH